MINVKTKSIWPVSVEEVKSHLRIDPDDFDNDSYIEKITIPAATRDCENFIGKDLALTSNVLTIERFSSNEIRIDAGNLISVDYVITDASTLITDYTLVKERDYFTLEFNSSVTSDPLKIEFKTGYQDGECPEDIKLSILMKCADSYDVERSSYALQSYKKNEIDGIEIVKRRLMPHKIILW